MGKGGEMRYGSITEEGKYFGQFCPGLTEEGKYFGQFCPGLGFSR